MHFAVVSLCVVLSLSGTAVSSQSTADKPNIIFFLIDDLGWNDTGYQGGDFKTPAIDKLAGEGIRLKQYYVQPLCSPSRAALMTGRYPYNLGLARGVLTNGYPYGLGLNETTIAQMLKKGGYTTHVVGKWDLGMCKWEYTPTYRGFDSFYGYYDAQEDYYTHKSLALFYDVVPVSGLDLRNNTEPVTNETGTYSTDLFTREMERIIKNHNESEGPFFLYGAYQSVHAPLEVPDKYKAMCSDLSIENRQTFCGMTKALDEGINNITLLLESIGMLKNTIIIFSTDNGGQAASSSRNWPLRGNKATVFEGGMRGQGFVWGANLPKKNFDSSQLMHITDWVPTIVEGIAGLPLDAKTMALDGYNMWDALTTNTASPRTEILLQLDPANNENRFESFRGQAALRSGDWKLIVGEPGCRHSSLPAHIDCPTGWVYQDGKVEEPPDNPSYTWLFNITADPTERENVATEYPDVVTKLKQRIEMYNSTHINQVHPGIDPKSNPHHFGGIWTPWIK